MQDYQEIPEKSTRKILDDLPAERISAAINLLNRLRAVLPEGGMIGVDAPREAHIAALDLLDCGHVDMVSGEDDFSEKFVSLRGKF